MASTIARMSAADWPFESEVRINRQAQEKAEKADILERHLRTSRDILALMEEIGVVEEEEYEGHPLPDQENSVGYRGTHNWVNLGKHRRGHEELGVTHRFSRVATYTAEQPVIRRFKKPSSVVVARFVAIEHTVGPEDGSRLLLPPQVTNAIQIPDQGENAWAQELVRTEQIDVTGALRQDGHELAVAFRNIPQA